MREQVVTLQVNVSGDTVQERRMEAINSLTMALKRLKGKHFIPAYFNGNLDDVEVTVENDKQ